MKTNIMLPLAACAALIAAAPGLAQNGGRPLSTSLTGAEEVPGPGDPDGSGNATLRVNPGKMEVCYTITVSKIDPATGAHIHEAPRGSAGPIVVNLKPPVNGRSEGCATVTRELAMEIIREPGDYYVNVHNPAFPAGAVRGQLGK